MNDWLKGKAILVTGGTGYFGRHFVKTVLGAHDVARLVVFSRDELKQEELRTRYHLTDHRIRYFLGDIRERDRLPLVRTLCLRTDPFLVAQVPIVRMIVDGNVVDIHAKPARSQIIEYPSSIRTERLQAQLKDV